MDAGHIIMYVFLMLFGIGLFVYLQGFIMTLDMTGWTFGGKDFVKLIVPVMPTMLLITLIGVPVYFIAKEAH